MKDPFLSLKEVSASPGDRTLIHVVRGLWIAFAVVVSVKAFVQPDVHTVYPVFVLGAERWWNDLPLHATIEELHEIYRYSPTFAILFTPLAVLPVTLGQIIWNLFSLGILYAAAARMVRDLLPGEWTLVRKAGFAALVLLGSVVGIWSAQSNSLIVAVVIFAGSAIVRRRWWTAAVLLGLPVFIKLWPLAAGLLLAACWPKQLSWRLAVVLVVLAFVPFLTRPPGTVLEQYWGWYESLTSSQQGRWAGFRDAWTIWENLWPPVSKIAYHVLQLATAGAVLFWCLGQKRRIIRLSGANYDGYLITLVISIWVAWQLLFGPGTEQLTYGIIAPSAAWAVTVSFTERRHRAWTLATFFTLASLGSGDIEKLFVNLHPAATMLLPLAVISFLAWLLWHERGTGAKHAKPQAA